MKKIIYIFLLILAFCLKNVYAENYCQYEYEGAVLTVYETGAGTIGYLINANNANKITNWPWDNNKQADIVWENSTAFLESEKFFLNGNFNCSEIYYIITTAPYIINEKVNISFATNPVNALGDKSGKYDKLSNFKRGEYDKYCEYEYTYNNEQIITRFYVGNGKINGSIVYNSLTSTDTKTDSNFNNFLDSNGIFSCPKVGAKYCSQYVRNDVWGNKTLYYAFIGTPNWLANECPTSASLTSMGYNQVDYKESINKLIIQDSGLEPSDLDCNGLLAGDFGRLLKSAFNLIRFIVPILIIVLTIVDYIKAIISQDQKEINKATQKFIKRLIIGAILFVLPTLIELMLSWADIPYGTCDIK